MHNLESAFCSFGKCHSLCLVCPALAVQQPLFGAGQLHWVNMNFLLNAVLNIEASGCENTKLQVAHCLVLRLKAVKHFPQRCETGAMLLCKDKKHAKSSVNVDHHQTPRRPANCRASRIVSIKAQPFLWKCLTLVLIHVDLVS